MTVAAQVGDSRQLLAVDGLTRTQIVQYAGASGDFNPIHTDEVYAASIGFPSVFAHGMLTMALSGRVLTDWFGPDSVIRFGVRFRQQVWPGDSLTVSASVTAVRRIAEGGAEVNLELVSTNQEGVTVLTGTATVAAAS